MGINARSGPQTVLERPQLAALLGAITAEWGTIENLVADIFNIVSLSKPIPIAARSKSELANLIFSHFRNFSSQIELIKSVMKLRVDNEVISEFDQLSREIRSRSKMRNDLVHTKWHVSDDYPEDLIKISGKYWIRYTEPDLQEILNQSTNTRNNAFNFTIRLSHSPMKDVD
ncbi:MAG: hypothetical protein ABJN26_25450 [Stappiaceae bacterium]